MYVPLAGTPKNGYIMYDKDTQVLFATLPSIQTFNFPLSFGVLGSSHIPGQFSFSAFILIFNFDIKLGHFWLFENKMGHFWGKVLKLFLSLVK